MSEGALFKPDKDFSATLDEQLPEIESSAKGNLPGALEKLLALEKQTRLASDLASTTRLLVLIVKVCKEAGNWDLLNENVLMLSKKHGQLKQAITKMVQAVMECLDDTPNLDTKLSVIETLRTVTEGKIFVEVERARVTRILSHIKKSQGDLAGATTVLCELQVETFGSMDRREKTEFILEQVEMCIEKGDWTQAGILSRKISTKFITSSDDVSDLKLKYYDQQIKLAKQDNKYLDACKHYRAVYETKVVLEDEAKLRSTLERIIYYVILAPYDNEQHDLLHRIYLDPKLSLVPKQQALLKSFTITELMRWPLIAENYGPELLATDVFSGSPDADTRWEDLRKRVIEHNVRVVAKYYTRITMDRLRSLLDLNEDETESYISQLVTQKTIYAKIDRPARVVNFAKPRDADDVLNEWSGNMKSLLGLLERIDHLITREEMMANIQPKVKTGKAKA